MDICMVISVPSYMAKLYNLVEIFEKFSCHSWQKNVVMMKVILSLTIVQKPQPGIFRNS